MCINYKEDCPEGEFRKPYDGLSVEVIEVKLSDGVLATLTQSDSNPITIDTGFEDGGGL